MPVLGVCGDSFLAATQDLPNRPDCAGSGGKHFTELLAKKLNYDYFTLARGACSNTAIRLQIQQMIQRNVDFIVIGTTSIARIEYPVREGHFDPFRNIYNIIYDYHPDISSTDSNFLNPTVASDTINNILEGYAIVRDDEQLYSIKRFFQDVYEENTKRIQDHCIIANGISAIKEAKIPYLVLCNMDFIHSEITPFNQNDKRILMPTDEKNTYLLPYMYDTYDEETGQDTPRRYHVSDKNQVAICQHLCQYINSNDLLVWS